MDNTRRDFLKLGRAMAVGAATAGALLPTGERALAADAAAPAVPVPQSTAGALRLVTFVPDGGGPPRVGAVTAAGAVVDLGAAAAAQGIRPGFDPAQMLSLIAAGPSGLETVRRLVAAAPAGGPPVSAVRLLPPIPVP